MPAKYKLAVLVSHPIQYQTPLFRKLAEHSLIDMMVYFWSDKYAVKTFDPGFNISLKWDIPLLAGYKYKFLTNSSIRTSGGIFRQIINPIVIKELFFNDYDAFWIHGYITLINWFAFCGAQITKTPILFRGESNLLKCRPLWKKIVKRMVLPLFFRRISAFLTIGTLNAEYYKYYGVSTEKLFFVPYAIDNTFFSSSLHELRHERRRLKEKIGISSESLVILYTSKMIPQKRPMDLLLAYEKIKVRINAALVFVGDGVEKPLLEAYAKKRNLKDVYFAGFKNQTEVPSYFVIADVFVLPSGDDSWGLVINEVMNFGLPVITTNKVGVAYDLIKNGHNGYIYPAGDIDKLTEYLNKILNDSKLREEMGRNSLEIISNWSYKEDIDGILAALEYIKREKKPR